MTERQQFPRDVFSTCRTFHIKPRSEAASGAPWRENSARFLSLFLFCIRNRLMMTFQNATLGETIKCLALWEFGSLAAPCSSHACAVFAVCAFPYILAFTTDSIEIRLVVNGNLVYTAVVPELQLTASRVSMTLFTTLHL